MISRPLGAVLIGIGVLRLLLAAALIGLLVFGTVGTTLPNSENLTDIPRVLTGDLPIIARVTESTDLDSWSIHARDQEDREIAASAKALVEAELELPARVYIYFSDRTRSCDGASGLAVPPAVEGRPYAVFVCEDDPRYTRETLLHELGHVWTDTSMAREHADCWLDTFGYEGWDDLELEWEIRGIEVAAEVFMWHFDPSAATFAATGPDSGTVPPSVRAEMWAVMASAAACKK